MLDESTGSALQSVDAGEQALARQRLHVREDRKDRYENHSRAHLWAPGDLHRHRSRRHREVASPALHLAPYSKSGQVGGRLTLQ